MVVPYDTNEVEVEIKTDSPTLKQIETLQDAFDLMNRKLFEGVLPQIMISQNNKSYSEGYFSPKKWKGKITLDEININPEAMNQDTKKIFSVLLHQMVHLWQEYYGEEKSRLGYHNREWAERMLSLGLRPRSLDTGKDGFMIGQKVKHEIIVGGKFDELFNRVQNKINYYVSDTDKKKEVKERKKKIKYTCPDCKNNVWGKPELEISCKKCGIDFEEQPS